MKPKDVTDDSFVEYSEETNEKDPKFKVGFLFFYEINIYTKSNKTKIHTAVPRRHIFSPVGGNLKCLNT